MKMNVINKNGEIVDVKLNLRDMADLQTKESKRTFVLGMASSAVSIASMFAKNRTIKSALMIVGCVGAAITTLSCADCFDKIDSEENIQHTNDMVDVIAKRHGVE